MTPRRAAGTTAALVAAVVLGASAAPQLPHAPESPGASAPLPAAAASASATPGADARLQQVRDRRRSLEQELGRLRRQERSLLGEVERLELEVRLRGEQLREVQLTLQRTNEQLDATVKRLRAVEAQIAQARPELLARARALYKLGELSYLRMLLSVDRPSDMLRGYRFVTTLARRDNERFVRFRGDLRAEAAARTELERRTQEALTQRAEVERARRGLDAERRRKTELLTQIVERKETQALYVEELKQAEARLDELVAGLHGEDAPIPIAAFRGTLPWPAAGRVRVPFGRRKHPRFDTYTLQNGVEIEAQEGSPIGAVHEGVVAFADRFRGYGLMVILDHGNKHHTLYGHLGELAVKVGQRVAQGAAVGSAGTGLDGTGVYFEVRFQGRPEDPADWLKRERK